MEGEERRMQTSSITLSSRCESQSKFDCESCLLQRQLQVVKQLFTMLNGRKQAIITDHAGMVNSIRDDDKFLPRGYGARG